jgi:outer membrane protein assembly factor BamA
MNSGRWQQPNARFFGAPWKLWLYNAIDSTAVAEKKIQKLAQFEAKYQKKRAKVTAINAKRNARAISRNKADYRFKSLPDSTFKQAIWAEKLKYKYGQKPVVFDTVLHQKNEDQLRRYLVKKGYYYGSVKSELNFSEQSRSVQAVYHIDEGPQYIIDSVVARSPSEVDPQRIPATWRTSATRPTLRPRLPKHLPRKSRQIHARRKRL